MIEEQFNHSSDFLDPFAYLDHSSPEPYPLWEEQDHYNPIQKQEDSDECAKTDTRNSAKQKRIMKVKKAKSKYMSNNKIEDERILVGLLKNDQSKPFTITQEAKTSFLKEEELKKKKRISAQNSRDKKIQYIKQIEEENESLKRKCRALELENEELKRPSESPYSFTLNFGQKLGWSGFSSFKASLKSWFIMSLILLSLQKDSILEPDYHQIYSKYHDPHQYFSNVNNLLIEYEKSPLSERICNLENFKHFNDLDTQDSPTPDHHITPQSPTHSTTSNHETPKSWTQCLQTSSLWQL